MEMIRPDLKDALKDRKVKRVLPRYVKAVNNRAEANFQIAKRIVFNLESNMAVAQLWREHEGLMKKFYETKQVIDKKKLKIEDLEVPRFSLIDLKIMLTKEIMKRCELCERKCEVNRLEEKGKFCGVANECFISSEFIHMGEEPFISPSHTIFFMGCPLKCQFCQNFTISQWYEKGTPVEAENLAKIVDERRRQGVRNVNFVGGEPTPNLLWVLEILKHSKENVPVIWNSNFYMSEKTMKILDGIVDLYLPDFKYGNDLCASRLSKVKNYFEIVSRNHLIASKQAEVTIRHLILPSHVDCCSKPVLDWIAKNIRKNSIVNLMNQFRPEFKAREHIDINRNITGEELREVVSYAKKLKINYIT
jgi:putative pyruvate formate lyase activating enzyme